MTLRPRSPRCLPPALSRGLLLALAITAAPLVTGCPADPYCGVCELRKPVGSKTTGQLKIGGVGTLQRFSAVTLTLRLADGTTQTTQVQRQDSGAVDAVYSVEPNAWSWTDVACAWIDPSPTRAKRVSIQPPSNEPTTVSCF